MPFNNKRNSRDDNSRKRSNSENFTSKSGRNSQRPSSANDRKSSDRKSFGSNKFDKDADKRPDHAFAKFDKRNDKKFNRSEKPGSDRPYKDNYRSEGKPFGKRDEKRYDDRKDSSERPRFTDRSDRRPFNKDNNRKKIAEAEPKDDGLIRLNRYISNSGICSRRKADELIQSGVVSVNGEAVTELGTKVDPAKDEIRYNGERLKREKMVYVLLNKPKDYITTTDDPQERRTVMHLVAKATKERIYPVGRLDRNTTGLLLLTNDGNLADKLSHPRNNISKIYNVELSKNLTQGDLNKIQFGIELEDGFIKPDDISYVQGASKREVGIQIHSGKNRIVRRIFESLGYEVIKLDRVVYANLTKKDLPRGRWRYLEERELIQLKHFIK